MDLFINVALTASSVALFCYWFRYGCLLILAAETPHDYSEEVARTNHLSFPEVRSRLRKHNVADIECLHKNLQRDFRIIVYLLENTSIARSDTRLEHAMLKIQYRAMSVWFRLTRRLLLGAASEALEEMSEVLAHFANQMCEGTLAMANQAR
jgi:hypothetical protein